MCRPAPYGSTRQTLAPCRAPRLRPRCHWADNPRGSPSASAASGALAWRQKSSYRNASRTAARQTGST